LQDIECDFSYAGCNEKLQRQDMEKHIEENSEKHLALMAAASMKMNRELQEQRNEFRGYVEQKERETAEQLKQKDEQIESIQASLREKDKKFEKLQQDVKGELHEKQQQIEALKEQIIQVKQDHREPDQKSARGIFR